MRDNLSRRERSACRLVSELRSQITSSMGIIIDSVVSPGLSRGLSPGGNYQFQVSGYNPKEYEYEDIPLTHNQVTSTAETPIHTVESTASLSILFYRP